MRAVLVGVLNVQLIVLIVLMERIVPNAIMDSLYLLETVHCAASRVVYHAIIQGIVLIVFNLCGKMLEIVHIVPLLA
jgi:hypothetical protein